MKRTSWRIRLAAFPLLLAAATVASGDEAPQNKSERAKSGETRAERNEGIQGELIRSDRQSLIIRTEDGSEKSFKLNDSSRLELDGREARFGQLKPGQRLRLNLDGETIRGAHSIREDLPPDRGLGQRNESNSVDRSETQNTTGAAGAAGRVEEPNGQSPLRLGVLLGPSPTVGAKIHQVDPNSPAARAGFQAGDFIVRLNGRDITRSDDVGEVLSTANREEELVVSLWRNGQTTENRISLGESRVAGFRGDPNAEDSTRQPISNNGNSQFRSQSSQNVTDTPRAWLGVAFQEANQQSNGARPDESQNRDGASLRSVFPGSPAERAGLRIGDRVRRFNDQDIDNGQQVVTAMQQAEPGTELRLTIVRDGEETVVNVNLEDREEFFRNSRR